MPVAQQPAGERGIGAGDEFAESVRVLPLAQEAVVGEQHLLQQHPPRRLGDAGLTEQAVEALVKGALAVGQRGAVELPASRVDLGRVGLARLRAAMVQQGHREAREPDCLVAELRESGVERGVGVGGSALRVRPLDGDGGAPGTGAADVPAPERDGDAGAEGAVVAGEPLEPHHGTLAEDAAAAGGELEPDDAGHVAIGEVPVHAGADAERGDVEQRADAAVQLLGSTVTSVQLPAELGDADHGAPEIARDAEVALNQEQAFVARVVPAEPAAGVALPDRRHAERVDAATAIGELVVLGGERRRRHCPPEQEKDDRAACHASD